MSWSVTTTGKAKVAAQEIAKQFAAIPATGDPEESIKKAAAEIIAKSLAAFSPEKIVSITAGGTQLKDASGVTNALDISIKPEWT